MKTKEQKKKEVIEQLSVKQEVTSSEIQDENIQDETLPPVQQLSETPLNPVCIDLFTNLYIGHNGILRGMEINRGVVLDNGTSMIFIPNCIIDKEKLTIKGTL